MNKVMMIGRIAKDPDVRYTAGDNPTAVAKFSLAVDRRTKDKSEADFFNIVAFKHNAEFTEMFLKKGTKIFVCGRLQTDSYTNKEGQKVYSTSIVADEFEFCESKNAEAPKKEEPKKEEPKASETFISIPDNIDDGELPFNI